MFPWYTPLAWSGARAREQQTTSALAVARSGSQLRAVVEGSVKGVGGEMTEGIHLARQLEASRQHVIEIPTSYVPSENKYR